MDAPLRKVSCYKPPSPLDPNSAVPHSTNQTKQIKEVEQRRDVDDHFQKNRQHSNPES